MNRRQLLSGIATACVSGWGASAKLFADEGTQTGLGLVTYCQSLRRKQRLTHPDAVDLFDPLTFLQHCRSLGAGGMQVAIGVLQSADASRLRQECEQQEMFLEAIISLPRDAAGVDQFRTEMQSARNAGARAVRCVIIPGRRYEQFHSLAEFHRAEAAGRQMLKMAAPIAESLRLPLAVENHKDHRNVERVRLFESISSEYVGACVDTGNSLALLEDPLETVRALSPWAHAVHLKDQAVQATPDGFLLADIPLGQGCLDLPAMVKILRTAKPGIPMCLELITRDPLVIPCLSENYWRPFDAVPASDLASTLRLVRDCHAEKLTRVSDLSQDHQVELEAAQVRESLRYAGAVLGL